MNVDPTHMQQRSFGRFFRLTDCSLEMLPYIGEPTLIVWIYIVLHVATTKFMYTS